MIKIISKPKKLPKFPRNLKNYQNPLETYKMTKIPLEFLICRKYPRYIQNTPNLYFGNFRCFRCILVILHVQGYFGHNLGFRGFYRSFFKVWGYFCHFLGFGVFQSFFQILGYFGNFLGLGCCRRQKFFKPITKCHIKNLVTNSKLICH